MEESKRVFSESFKRGVVEEVNSGSLNKESARLRYGIKGKSAILLWQRNYQKYGRCSLNLGNETRSPLNPKKQSQPGTSIEELQTRIKELERQLEDEQLRSEAYSRIIDIAENEFKLPIRKKPSTR